MKQIDVATHNGVLKQFNYNFIYKGDDAFLDRRTIRKLQGRSKFGTLLTMMISILPVKMRQKSL